VREEVSRKGAGAGRQKRYDRCWRLRYRGLLLLLLKADWQGEDLRRDRRRGEGCTEAPLEVCRVFKNLRRKLIVDE
jgi:hypothetical protein